MADMYKNLYRLQKTHKYFKSTVPLNYNDNKPNTRFVEIKTTNEFNDVYVENQYDEIDEEIVDDNITDDDIVDKHINDVMVIKKNTTESSYSCEIM